MATHVLREEKDINSVSGLLQEKYPQAKFNNRKTNIIIKNKMIMLVVRQGRKSFKITGGLNFSYLPLLILIIASTILSTAALILVLIILEIIFRRKINKTKKDVANVLCGAVGWYSECL